MTREKPVDFDFQAMIVSKEARVSGGYDRAMFETWERMSRLVPSKRVNLTGVITDRLGLDDAEEGFQRIIEGLSGKVLFAP